MSSKMSMSFFRKEIKVFDENIIKLTVQLHTMGSNFIKLDRIEVHNMEKNPGMFSSKTLVSPRLKKERHGHLG